METVANIIQKYIHADTGEKVDIICKYYSNFTGILDGYTEGLCYLVESENAFEHRQNNMDLGVRVQSSGRISDVTADTAINKTMIRQAIVSCNFSEGILNGLSCRDNVFAMAHNLRCMRCDYELFNRQLGILGTEESKIFIGFISGKKKLNEIAEEEGILYDSAVKRVGRIKKKIKLQMLEFLEV